MKVIMLFPLEAQTVVAPDGVPRATATVPNGAKVLHLGQAFPTDIIGVFALVDPPESAEPGQAPMFKDVGRMEFAIVQPGGRVPDDFIYRAPVRTRSKLMVKNAEGLEMETVVEGLVFLFEKQGPKLMIVTPGGRG
jgi:hypothetical protein